jgi:hypothetical protein
MYFPDSNSLYRLEKQAEELDNTIEYDVDTVDASQMVKLEVMRAHLRTVRTELDKAYDLACELEEEEE